MKTALITRTHSELDLTRQIDVSKAKALGWTYKTELEDGIRMAYEDFLK